MIKLDHEEQLALIERLAEVSEEVWKINKSWGEDISEATGFLLHQLIIDFDIYDELEQLHKVDKFKEGYDPLIKLLQDCIYGN